MLLQDSVLNSYEHSEGKLTVAKGLTEIRAFFQGLFNDLSLCNLLTVPVQDVTEDPRQVFLVWDCPDSGVISATDTFVFESTSFEIMTQVTGIDNNPSIHPSIHPFCCW